MRRIQPFPWLMDTTSTVAEETGIPASQILGYSKKREISSARHKVIRRLLGMGRCKAEIARAMGLDWTTVHAVDRERPVFRSVRAGEG